MPEPMLIGIVICTRNRAIRVSELLENLRNLPKNVVEVVVVDSSTTADTFELINRQHSEKITYISSTPGLPHQRNLGVNHLLNRALPVEIVAFLDDDVSLPAGYFIEIGDQFAGHPDAACIGGFDLNLNVKPATAIETLLCLRGKRDFGRLLPSGIAVPIRDTFGTALTDWAPGHNLNVAAWALRKVVFNEKIRMYGEDVEFLLRLAQVGPIYASSSLGVHHNAESSGRDRLGEAESYNAGFRWWLAETYPSRFSKPRVVFSSLALMTGYALKGIMLRDRDAIHRSLGLVKFFVRLFAGRQVTQTTH